MRKLGLAIIVLLAIFLCFQTAHAEFTVTWDENVPAPDGYRIFDRTADTVYNYTQPLWEGPLPPVTITNLLPPPPETMLAPINMSATWDKVASSVTIDWNQPEPLEESVEEYFLVARAYMNGNGDIPDLESADSEEVSVIQKSKNTATKWDVYYSETSGGPYTLLDSVPATGNTRITAPLTVVPANQAKMVYFVTVAFGQNDTFSDNSEEASVLIDRRVLNPPVNMQITVTVPVE